jgi:hypothetical protein
MVRTVELDVAFEQFAGQSNVRGISDGLTPYAALGEFSDAGRSDLDHLQITKGLCTTLQMR